MHYGRHWCPRAVISTAGQAAAMPGYMTVSVQLEPDQIDALDALWEADDGPYESRSAAIRAAVDGLLDR